MTYKDDEGLPRGSSSFFVHPPMLGVQTIKGRCITQRPFYFS